MGEEWECRRERLTGWALWGRRSRAIAQARLKRGEIWNPTYGVMGR